MEIESVDRLAITIQQKNPTIMFEAARIAAFELLVAAKTRCQKCFKEMDIKQGRYGDFLACSDYSVCKTTRRVETKHQSKKAAQRAKAEPKAALDNPIVGDNTPVLCGFFTSFPIGRHTEPKRR